MTRTIRPKKKSAKLSRKLESALEQVKSSARSLRRMSTSEKRKFLELLAETLIREKTALFAANSKDLQIWDRQASSSSSLRDRLILNTEARFEALVQSLRAVSKLEDPVGQIVQQRTLESGLQLSQVRAPIGVILMIFESRPNVAIEALSIAFFSGNAVLLKGGKEARHTLRKMYELMMKAWSAFRPREGAPFFGIEVEEREKWTPLLKKSKSIDLVVPRGGEGLIRFVQENSTVPILKNDRGLCHLYWQDSSFPLDKGISILANAKLQRPSVCNSVETFLIDRSALALLPQIYEGMQRLSGGRLQWWCCSDSYKLLKGRAGVRRATSKSFQTEYLTESLNCKVVENLENALDHIEQYGSLHSEAILTLDPEQAEAFLSQVDAAAVYWNASTRFTDGFQMGLGAELGISTQKLQVRGPIGLQELTVPRWIGRGQGQIRSS